MPKNWSHSRLFLAMLQADTFIECFAVPASQIADGEEKR